MEICFFSSEQKSVFPPLEIYIITLNPRVFIQCNNRVQGCVSMVLKHFCSSFFRLIATCLDSLVSTTLLWLPSAPSFDQAFAQWAASENVPRVGGTSLSYREENTERCFSAWRGWVTFSPFTGHLLKKLLFKGRGRMLHNISTLFFQYWDLVVNGGLQPVALINSHS